MEAGAEAADRLNRTELASQMRAVAQELPGVKTKQGAEELAGRMEPMVAESPMGVGQLSESDAVDALRLPFYSSRPPTGSHGWMNQFDLGNPDRDLTCTAPPQMGQ